MTTYLYGFHAVSACLEQQPRRIQHIFLYQGRQDERLNILREKVEHLHIEWSFVDRDRLQHLAQTDKHQGVVAACETREVGNENELEALLQGMSGSGLFLVLDGVQDPHNLGACLRSANAAGASAVIIPKDKAAQLTPTVKKIASGAAEFIPLIAVTNLARTLKLMKHYGVWVYGFADQAAENLYEIEFPEKTALVMGNEGSGLRQLTQKNCDELLSIPMAGGVSSLNVSNAAAVALFEAVRQKKK